MLLIKFVLHMVSWNS